MRLLSKIKEFTLRILGLKVVKIVSLILSIIFFSLYIINRQFLAYNNNFIMNYFLINGKEFALLGTIFSISYGIFQLISGYIMTKFKQKSISIYAFILSLSCFLFYASENFHYVLFSRFLAGIGGSVGSIGLQFYLNQVWNKKYFEIFYSIALAIGYMLPGFFFWFNDWY